MLIGKGTSKFVTVSPSWQMLQLGKLKSPCAVTLSSTHCERTTKLVAAVDNLILKMLPIKRKLYQKQKKAATADPLFANTVMGIGIFLANRPSFEIGWIAYWTEK